MTLIGFVNINKPREMTSNDVVVRARGALKALSGDKKLKVGHLGTLDPLATGVLPIAVGRATRLFDLLMNKRKTYIASFKFGETTPTLDAGSEICQKRDFSLADDDVYAAAAKFVGKISQLPPQYSAKSVGGKRAYEIAREGGIADLTPKNVIVYSIKRHNLENFCNNEYGFQIECSSGTYIRALARDIAEALGTVGYMTSLCRTASGPFDLENAIYIEEFCADPAKYLLPVEFALGDMPAVTLLQSEFEKASNGVSVPSKMPDGAYRVYFEDRLCAVGDVKDAQLRLRIRL